MLEAWVVDRERSDHKRGETPLKEMRGKATNFLDEIIDYKKKELAERKKTKPVSVLEKQVEKIYEPIKFLTKQKKIQLIAELKKASPSKGLILKDFEPAKLAKICGESGASALSVLTEEKYFKGLLDYIPVVKKAVSIPVLRKDFIFDEYQIIESRAYGADAILLIVNVLRKEGLGKLLAFAHEFGLDVLTEVHSEDELKIALDSGADIIGVNNRDLKTFDVDIKNTERLAPMIPKGKIIVSESGIFTRCDMKYMEDLRIDAVLVGESIMASRDPSKKIKELLGA